MPYILRLIQQYHPSFAHKFMELESRFQELERDTPSLPKGKRYQPLSGSEPTNTLIWECEFSSLAEVQSAIDDMAAHPGHFVLFEEQLPYISKTVTEIYKVLDL